MDSSWKNSCPVIFFLSELSPFLELCPFEKIGIKSCQHVEEILSNFFRVMALWKFGHFKLLSKLSRKLFKLGAWNLVSCLGMVSRLPDKLDWGWWIGYLINFWTNSVEYFQSYSPLQKRAFQTCQQDFWKSIWARGLKLRWLIEDDE